MGRRRSPGELRPGPPYLLLLAAAAVTLFGAPALE
jgi:hypothetical protein